MIRNAIDPGGDAFLMIAAADSPSELKARADYVCDGTNLTGGDDVEINAALGVANVVILSPGTYWINATVEIGTGQSLIGGGPGCVMKLMDGIDAAINMIENEDQVGGNNRILIESLMLDGNKANNSAGDQVGIYFQEVSGSLTVPGSIIKGCLIENFRYYGIWEETNSRYNIIENCIVRGNTVQGIYIWSGSAAYCTIANNIIEANGDGIEIEGQYHVITGNQIRGNTAKGIFARSISWYFTVTGNVVEGNGGDGITFSGENKNHTITGNTCEGNGGSGIALSGSPFDQALVSGNNCIKNGSYGISISNVTHVLISENICQLNNYDGIRLASAPDSSVVGNFCYENSQGTHLNSSNIYVVSSDFCLVSSNICRQGALANKPAYGINISDAATNFAMVEGNSLYSSGATGDLNDAGTNTRKRDNLGNAGAWLADV